MSYIDGLKLKYPIEAGPIWHLWECSDCRSIFERATASISDCGFAEVHRMLGGNVPPMVGAALSGPVVNAFEVSDSSC